MTVMTGIIAKTACLPNTQERSGVQRGQAWCSLHPDGAVELHRQIGAGDHGCRHCHADALTEQSIGKNYR